MLSVYSFDVHGHVPTGTVKIQVVLYIPKIHVVVTFVLVNFTLYSIPW